MRSQRPKNLNLFTIQFPIPAIVSILHRVSGFILFLVIPFVLWALHVSLNESGFNDLQGYFQSPMSRVFVWLISIPFWFHLFAGIRHLLSDVHVGDSLKIGRLTAFLTFLLTFLFIILTGIWLW